MLAAAVIVPITLSGDGDRATPVSTSDSTAVAPSMPKEQRTPRPEDRDPAAVTAALRQLDPCQLLDLEVAKRRERPNAATIATGPHACLLVPSPAPEPSYVGGLKLTVGTFSDQFRRYRMAPVVLGGAKAYEYSRRSTSGSACTVAIPVSFVRAIELSVDMFGDMELCATVRQYAEGTVAKLGAPDAVAFRDITRPFSAWDGCSLLEKLLGESSDDYTYEPHGKTDPFGGCRTTDRSNDVGPSIDVTYDKAADLSGQTRQIGGRTVGLGGSGRCAATWDHGPNGNQNPWYAATVVTLYGKDCDTAAALAEQAIALAGQPPDTGDTAPQRPLLFGPDDNDTGSVGACADFAGSDGQEDCEPYHDVPVPKDPDDIMAAPEANRNAQCAVFKEAVEARFGKQFAPITWAAHCFFVDREHTVEIRVNVDPGNRPSDYGAKADLWTDRREITIAGRAAVTFWDTDRTTFEIYLSPYDNIDRPGNLHIAVEMLGGRGREIVGRPPLPQQTADLATDVMAQAVETYFR